VGKASISETISAVRQCQDSSGSPNLRLGRSLPDDFPADPDQEGVLENSREPQERPPGMRDDLPDGVEEQEPQPFRAGGPEIAG